MAIKFYVGTSCDLCEDAKIQIEFFKESFNQEIKIDTINIEEDDTLLEKYMLRIPVVEYDGQVLQEGNIDFITLTETYNQMK
ncbi:glutaredoxin family protein [Mammaliicoccus sciuri]|uniref:glutaredoxin family protein n=1 Tax=Mammaliicoccus sciuri TaxID=1296 RepID=UPI0020BE05B7|nr:glutaredoxin family protein [Mammaliicoccus sciuri]